MIARLIGRDGIEIPTETDCFPSTWVRVDMIGRTRVFYRRETGRELALYREVTTPPDGRWASVEYRVWWWKRYGHEPCPPTPDREPPEARMKRKR